MSPSHPSHPAPSNPLRSGAPAPAGFCPVDDREFERLVRRQPLAVFAEWFALARESEAVNPEAAALATADAAGRPQVRTVLLKQFSAEDGFVFFTNNQSRKAQAIAANPRAAMLFYWRALGRQASLEGPVAEIPRAQTEAYFRTRPRDSQIGAWASRQSRPLRAVADLRDAVAAREKEFAGKTPPAPPHWSGFRLRPARMEFWREGAFRLHRRVAFCADESGKWRAELLQP